MPWLKRSTLSMVLVAALLLATTACQERSIELGNDDSSNTPSSEQDHDDEEGEQIEEQEDFEIDRESYPSQKDPDVELGEVGELEGSWRVAYADRIEPFVDFTLYHEEGASTGEGDFVMGSVMGPKLDGEWGRLDSVELDGQELVVTWNPTDDDHELYRVEVAREDEDTYFGTFSAERYPETHEVEMTRR